MVILLFMTGLMVAFLGTLAGSGGLIGMPVMLLLGIPVHTSIATAKFSNIISSSSSFVYLLKDRKIKLEECLPIIPLAVTGGVAGAFLSDKIAPLTLQWMAFFFLLFALVLSLLKGLKPVRTQTKKAMPTGKLLLISMYDGLFGPGQATLLMYTHLKHGQDYLKTVALTRFQTFISCMGAFIIYAGNGHVDWTIAIPFATGALIGSQLSVRLASKISIRQAGILLNIVTLILILQVGFELFL
ncbi:sulfite exporter TauE/SafE family protein [Rossellomorea aquimaris]|uniref:sulfite exporter TauE/SafE family protein n=1 Tax=Rossellomorea aquimaris TaxID=189382 RepID=UPI001CD5CACC|nr:sulfite exporter TauE/SafE family protein [Rossellomorea aquimaris]MCA1056610.1 sulfite exporter TauE/SafE family protein [Rossellomorea aquimaris]